MTQRNHLKLTDSNVWLSFEPELAQWQTDSSDLRSIYNTVSRCHWHCLKNTWNFLVMGGSSSLQLFYKMVEFLVDLTPFSMIIGAWCSKRRHRKGALRTKQNRSIFSELVVWYVQKYFHISLALHNWFIEAFCRHIYNWHFTISPEGQLLIGIAKNQSQIVWQLSFNKLV